MAPPNACINRMARRRSNILLNAPSAAKAASTAPLRRPIHPRRNTKTRHMGPMAMATTTRHTTRLRGLIPLTLEDKMCIVCKISDIRNLRRQQPTTTTTEDESVIPAEFVSVQKHLLRVEFNTWLDRWSWYWEWMEGFGKARSRSRDYVYYMNEINWFTPTLVPHLRFGHI